MKTPECSTQDSLQGYVKRPKTTTTLQTKSNTESPTPPGLVDPSPFPLTRLSGERQTKEQPQIQSKNNTDAKAAPVRNTRTFRSHSRTCTRPDGSLKRPSVIRPAKGWEWAKVEQLPAVKLLPAEQKILWCPAQHLYNWIKNVMDGQTHHSIITS